jgi:hypothetical protein
MYHLARGSDPANAFTFNGRRRRSAFGPHANQHTTRSTSSATLYPEPHSAPSDRKHSRPRERRPLFTGQIGRYPNRPYRVLPNPDMSFAIDGRISDLLKFLIPKVGESFVLGHNVESQEIAQARPSPELAGALETILELAAL